MDGSVITSCIPRSLTEHLYLAKSTRIPLREWMPNRRFYGISTIKGGVRVSWVAKGSSQDNFPSLVGKVSKASLKRRRVMATGIMARTM